MIYIRKAVRSLSTQLEAYFTSGLVHYSAKWETGDSEAVTSMQEHLILRFLYFSVVSFWVLNNPIQIFVHKVFFPCTQKTTEEQRNRETGVPVLTSQPYYPQPPVLQGIAPNRKWNLTLLYDINAGKKNWWGIFFLDFHTRTTWRFDQTNKKNLSWQPTRDEIDSVQAKTVKPCEKIPCPFRLVLISLPLNEANKHFYICIESIMPREKKIKP